MQKKMMCQNIENCAPAPLVHQIRLVAHKEDDNIAPSFCADLCDPPSRIEKGLPV
jgi:hypothetical protein